MSPAETPRRVGLFGGSFDPIHRGHLEPVREARRKLDLDRVIYLPTARPPHKQDQRLAPAHARYTMVELALLDEDGLYASPFELREDQLSYTIDTIHHFRALWPDADLVLLVGDDSLAQLDTWRAWRWIVAAVEIAALLRPGIAREQILESLPLELRDADRRERLHFISNPPVDISSTELRALLADGREPPNGVVPPLVLDYARKYKLYVDAS